MANASIGDMIETLNAKAAAAGCAVKAEHHSIDRTWGDLEGVAISGGTAEDRERAAKYVEAYFVAKLAPRRSYSAQYALTDRGEQALVRGQRNDAWYDPRTAYGLPADAKPESVRVIGLVYWPGSD